MHNNIQRVLISEDEIKVRVGELGEIFSREYAGKKPIFIGILKGVVLFFGDMIRQISIPCQIDFMCVSSYSGTDSTGTIRIKKDLDVDIAGRHVVILEDIVDTGLTLSKVVALLKERNPASLKICTLLDKPDRRETQVDIDYAGFTIPNEFVVGYGLDFNEEYRNLPYVGILKKEAYAELLGL